ncbi:MAG: oxidoreductase [Rhodospirillaceae bacterium]|nr:oxidoreductase [Rhodospirillaceae bacterium]MYB12452.1 oxidoreductase [Rhodospirillaceae bacterium]MYG53886.1 oxidoreductase [Rhodospirillaceae bacterium]MYI51104.1 oxidoreductase [Rhodospirillaceae bacterium]
MTFRAILLEEDDGTVTGSVTELDEDRLPEGDVTVRIDYSDLNYKDGLILKGLARLVRTYPHVPGIDFSGTVEDSASPDFAPGDRVVLTGWGLGERHWGGFAQKARVRADWLVKVPDALSNLQAMAIGTAGFTAMISAMALEHAGLRPGAGPVLVTGASGGVGSVAVAILAALGHEVTASTGKSGEEDYLRGLGAASVIGRLEASGRPLEKAQWAGCVDTVGGATLATAAAQMGLHSAVAVCGNAGGNDLATTVLPFILRGVSLLGIDSVMYPAAPRKTAWQRLATDLPIGKLEAMTEVIPLGETFAAGETILKGGVRGRTVIDVNA